MGAYSGDTGALVWIAHDNQFFDRYGLEVELVPFEAGKLAADALLSGQVDVATAAEFVVVSNSFDHPDLRIIATVATANNNELVARRDRVKSPADLAGKRIGVTRKSAGEFNLGTFLALNGLSFADVELVDLPPSGIVSAILAGDIDAGFTWDPNVYMMSQGLGENAISWAGQPWQQYHFVLATTERWLQERQPAAKALLEALLAAEQELRSNLDSSKALIANRFDYDQHYLDYSWDRHEFRIELPQSLLVAMEDQARWRIENGLTAGADIPDFLTTLATDPLSSLRAHSVTVIK